jgi:zeta-carotene isomerase
MMMQARIGGIERPRALVAAPAVGRMRKPTAAAALVRVAAGRAPSSSPSLSPLPRRLPTPTRAASSDEPATTTTTSPPALIGEDAAAFSFEQQSIRSWAIFGVLVSLVMGGLYLAWISPSGPALGAAYVRAVQDACGDSSPLAMLVLLGIFGVAHSGLASLRPLAEPVVGARAWRVLFALVSLPLATSAIVFFINHRYDGSPLWDVRGVPGVHELVWITSLVSFFFLYPSTFNLLEVAAVDEPKLHLWETGVTRITRHPQAVGQGLWCMAHTLWVGTPVMVAATVGLMAHHLFGVWNGDRRLRDKHGESFEAVKARTSVWPFAAIADGRQVLPKDYWREWVRWPYAVILVATLGAYWAHPIMQSASYGLKW